MIPWDWIGMVTMRRLTRRRTSMTGHDERQPGVADPDYPAEAKQDPCSYCLTIRSERARASSTTTTIATPTAKRVVMGVPTREVTERSGGERLRSREAAARTVKALGSQPVRNGTAAPPTAAVSDPRRRPRSWPAR